MNVNLSAVEKDSLSRLLSLRAKSGGWFFVGMALLALLLAGIGVMGQQRPFTTDTLALIVTLETILLGIAGWLFKKSRQIRPMLDGDLRRGYGRILHQHTTPYSGWLIQLEVQTPTGETHPAHITVIGLPVWAVGDVIELLFVADGRFFPRHLQQPSQLAHVHTLNHHRQQRRLFFKIVFAFTVLAIIGFLLGLYGQGHL